MSSTSTHTNDDRRVEVETESASFTSRLRRVAAAVLVGCFLIGASPSLADEHNPERAGHPLRIAAYVVYPVGVLIDTLIMRPAHWLVHSSALKSLFGHSD